MADDQRLSVKQAADLISDPNQQSVQISKDGFTIGELSDNLARNASCNEWMDANPIVKEGV